MSAEGRGRSEEAGEPTRSRSLVRGIPFCLAVFLCTRIVLSVLGVATVEDAPPLRSVGFPDAGIDRPVTEGWHNAFEGTYRWDAGWFILISERGYDPDDGSAEFYPLFPLAARLVAAILPIGVLGAAILVSNLAYLGALIVLYALSMREFDEVVARRTVVLLAVFPAAVVYMAPFSEAMFLLASLTAFYLARTDRWLSAGVAGIAACATRAVGVLLVPALMVEAWAAGRQRPTSRLVAAGLPVVGLIAYLAYWQIAWGDGLAPLRAPALWDRTTQFPVATLGRGVVLGIQGVFEHAGLPWTADLVMTSVVVVPLAIGWRLLRTSYLLYAVTTLLVVLTVTYAPRPLIGGPRYVGVLFPAFWILAIKLSHRGFLVTATLFAAAYVVVAIAFMQQRVFVL